MDHPVGDVWEDSGSAALEWSVLKTIPENHWPCKWPEVKCGEKRPSRKSNVFGPSEQVGDIRMNQIFLSPAKFISVWPEDGHLWKHQV